MAKALNDTTKETYSEDEAETILTPAPNITATYGFDDKPAEDEYTPEGFDTQEDFLQDMRENYQLDLLYDKENRESGVEDKRFAAGEQWDPLVVQHRAGLPCLVLNTVPQFTAQVVGDWRSNRSSVKVVPAEDGDVDVADIRSDLIRSIEVTSRASRVYDNAFESMLQCGDGAYQITVEYANDDVFDQDIRVRPIDDPFSVVWDRMSIDPTGRDATRVFVDERLSKKDFKKLFGDIPSSEMYENTRNEHYIYGWVDDDSVRVTAYWRLLTRKKLITMFQDGSMHIIDEKTPGVGLQELTQKHGPAIRSRVSPCRYAQMHLCTGFKILSGPYEYKLNRLPVIRMSGRVINIGNRRIRHGIVRFMKDPVRLRNFWRSIAAEQLGYAPKAQWIANEKAVEGREDKLRKAHLSRDPLLVVNDDVQIGRDIQRIDPPQIQAALLNEAQINTQDLKDITGIHDASLGIKSNETSGRAIMARQREGDIANLTYHDNGNASILEGGDVINQLIGQIYDATRIIRIIGQDESAKLIKVNDPDDPKSPDLAVGQYDVAITTGASYTTRRIEAAEAMMDAVQVFPQLMQVAGDIIAKAQDWPGAQELAERLRKTIPPELLEGETDEHGQPIKPTQPNPQTQELMAQTQQLGQENQSLKADKSVEVQKIKIDMFNAETQRMKVLMDYQNKNHANVIDAQEAEMKKVGKSE